MAPRISLSAGTDEETGLENKGFRLDEKQFLMAGLVYMYMYVPPFNPIFIGAATDLKKNLAMVAFFSGFLGARPVSGDPNEVVRREKAHQERIGNPGKALHSHRQPSRSPRPLAMIHNPATHIADIMPPCAEVWITASNAMVKQKGSWAINSGFVVLKPLLLCRVQTSERQQLYLTNWLPYRTPFITSIMDGTGYALSSERWCDILHLQGERSENPESKQATGYQILRQCFQNSGLELSLDQQNEDRSTEALRNPHLGMEVIFELCSGCSFMAQRFYKCFGHVATLPRYLELA
ncbi:hypothetical protein C8J56DRAFT_895345 [Mycena floridula]|nr:hypothetical protein C8J56DRAFT_895345 [Mycena floridula]